MYGSSHTQTKYKRAQFRQTFQFTSNELTIPLGKFKGFLKSTNAESPMLILGVNKANIYKFQQCKGAQEFATTGNLTGLRTEGNINFLGNRQAPCMKNFHILWDNIQPPRKNIYQYDQNGNVDSTLFYNKKPISLDQTGWNDVDGNFTITLGSEFINGTSTLGDGTFGAVFGSCKVGLKSTMRFMPENFDNSKENEWDDVELNENEVVIDASEVDQIKLKIEWELFEPTQPKDRPAGYDLPQMSILRRYMFGDDFSQSLQSGYIFLMDVAFVTGINPSSTRDRWYFVTRKADYYIDVEMYICTP